MSLESQHTMSRRNVSASTTTTPLATTALETPQLKAFVRSAMEKYGLTEQEVRKRAIVSKCLALLNGTCRQTKLPKHGTRPR